MRNKTLALFGIGTYILSVLTSATDSAGNSKVPLSLVAVSALATVVFYFIAAKRTWDIQKSEPLLLIISATLGIVLSAIQGQGIAPIYINLTKIANVLAFFWVVSILWAMARLESVLAGSKVENA